MLVWTTWAAVSGLRLAEGRTSLSAPLRAVTDRRTWSGSLVVTEVEVGSSFADLRNVTQVLAHGALCTLRWKLRCCPYLDHRHQAAEDNTKQTFLSFWKSFLHVTGKLTSIL